MVPILEATPENKPVDSRNGDYQRNDPGNKDTHHGQQRDDAQKHEQLGYAVDDILSGNEKRPTQTQQDDILQRKDLPHDSRHDKPNSEW
jgi:hypothetical protein